MKTISQPLLSTVCLSAALFAGAAAASSSSSTSQAQGGVIHFVGAIVEDPCDIGTTSQHISMSCYRNGKMHTSTISYQQASLGKPVSNDLATVSMRYINPQKTLGVVTIDYR